MKTIIKKSAFSIFSSLLLLGAVSCIETDKTEDPAPLTSAVITITSPTEKSTMNATDSVHITGTIAGKQTLHGYTISIRKKADGTEVFYKSIHDHKTAINIDQKWGVNGIHNQTDLVLEIVTSLDHNGNKASKKVNFQLQP